MAVPVESGVTSAWNSHLFRDPGGVPMRSQLAPAVTRALALLVFSTIPLHAQHPDATPPHQNVAPAQQTDVTESEAAPEHEPGESLACIVRLSQAKGVVQMDRNTGNGFEATSPNMPVVQGVRLRTGDGLAEVEFEDNSSLRLTPGTEVDFPELKLRQTGAKATILDVKSGSVYVSMAATRDMDFSVQFAGHTLTLSPSAHVHLFVGQPLARLTVFSGEARVSGPDGTATAEKKQTLTFDATGPTPPQVAKGLLHDEYDEWDKNEVDYQKRYALVNSFSGSPYGYGLADLNYYGNFIDAGGCGQMWQPYFVGAGWSPYSAGLWAWYPGAGYSYVSQYPWGWTPFHSGEWAYCQGNGWGWRPTGGWNGLGNLRKLRVTSPSGIRPPTPPPPPRPRQPTLTLAKENAPLPVSGVQPNGEFRFSNNSAGLGVPRGAFTHLNKISANVQQHGIVTTTPNSRVINTVIAGSAAFHAGDASSTPGSRTAVTPAHTATVYSNSSHSSSSAPAAAHASAPAPSGAHK